MPVGKKLVVVASVMATGLTAALFFRKDASQVAPWHEAEDESPFRERVERRVAADAAWPHTSASSQNQAAPPAHRVPASATASISDQQPESDPQPTFQKSFNPVGALLEPIGSTPEVDYADQPTDDGGSFESTAGASVPVLHRIADGDTLTRLAQSYLGSAERYLEIFELNRDVLSSPDLLPIGVVLKIPPRTATPPAGPAAVPNSAATLGPALDLVPVQPSTLTEG